MNWRHVAKRLMLATPVLAMYVQAGGAALPSPPSAVLDLVAVEDLQSARIAASVRVVRVQGYYRDLADSGAAATWIRGAPGTRGPGVRTSADGAAWQLAETTINPTMLGAHNSDRRRGSDAPIAETLALANGGLPGESRAGGRTVVFSPPRMITPFPQAGGAYVVGEEVHLQPGVALVVEQGAEILAARHFRGKAVVASADHCAWQCVGARLVVYGTINADGHAPFGIILRSATKVSVAVPGQVVRAVRGALYIGSLTTRFPPFENDIGPFNGYAPRGRWPARNDPLGVGVELGRSSDNFVHDVVIAGYRTGYRDGGQNNGLRNAHIYTASDRATGFGPLTTCYDLQGGHAVIADPYCDTPTTMQDRSIGSIAAFRLGPRSQGYIVHDPRIFLNYDNLKTQTLPHGGISVRTLDDGAALLAGNSVDRIRVAWADRRLATDLSRPWSQATNEITVALVLAAVGVLGMLSWLAFRRAPTMRRSTG